MKEKEYYIGIDYGTSNSCVGLYMNSVINIIPNKIGERTTPSLVCFTNDKIYVGEDTLNQKMEDNNLIYEVKRFIGMNYEELINSEFVKNLNYDIINQDGKPLIKVHIKGGEQLYSPEEISSLIIKKIVSNAEDFLNENGSGVKINKAVMTVPVHFSKNQKDALRTAARLADIEIVRIINEPTAAALAYGLGENLITEREEKKRKLNNLSNIDNDNCDVAPSVKERRKKKENIIVFDLGGGTFDLTLLNVRKKEDTDFEIIGTNGISDLGGSDFDNLLVDYCIKIFCKANGLNENEIRKNKKACKRLKIKCESAKKLLSESNEAFIKVDQFFQEEDFLVKITIDKFEEICKNLFDQIKSAIDELLKNVIVKKEDIDSVILIGGATRMKGIKNILKSIFGERKIKDNINPDETVAYGATLQYAKIEQKDKINFNLQDIIPYDLGIAVVNNNINELNKGQIMYILIPKYSKIPNFSDDKPFRVVLNEKNRDIYINIYEGNNKYVEENIKLDTMIIKDINKLGRIDYTVKFTIDVNCKLTVFVTIHSLKKNFTKTIEKDVTNAFLDKDKKKIKINKNKLISPLKSVIVLISSIKDNIENFSNAKEKLEKLIDCSNGYDQIISNYMFFAKDNDYALEKVYDYTKELFYVYLDIIKLIIEENKNDDIKKIINKEKFDKKDIIEKIKENMKNLISVVGYVTSLLDIFEELLSPEYNNKNYKNIFYIIFTYFIKLMNNEGDERMKNIKYRRYFSKLYYEKAFYSYKQYIKDDDLYTIDIDIKLALDKEMETNRQKLNDIKSYAIVIESLANEKKFLIGNSGFTLLLNEIKKLDNPEDLTVDEIQELLDLFKNMEELYTKKERPIEKAYCLANIITIKYKLLKVGITDKLLQDIDKFNCIMEEKDEKYNWYIQVKKIIYEIENRNND